MVVIFIGHIVCYSIDKLIIDGRRMECMMELLDKLSERIKNAIEDLEEGLFFHVVNFISFLDVVNVGCEFRYRVLISNLFHNRSRVLVEKMGNKTA